MILLLAALVPSACVIWFMNAAIENQQLAMRQRLTDLYLSELDQVRKRISEQLEGRVSELTRAARSKPSEAFSQTVYNEVAPSAIVIDRDQQIVYPTDAEPVAMSDAFVEHCQHIEAMEFSGKLSEAIAACDDAIKNTADVNEQAILLLIQSRCQVKLTQYEKAMSILTQTLAADRYADAHDAMGRHILSDALLRAWALSQTHAPDKATTIQEQLRNIVYSYSTNMPSSQRRFLMSELAMNHPVAARLLDAEKLAGQVRQRHPVIKYVGQMYYSDQAQCWLLSGANGRVIGLFAKADIEQFVATCLQDQTMLSQVRCVAHTDDDRPSDVDARLTVPVSPLMPGWSISVYDQDQNTTADSNRITAVYLWSAIAVIGFLAICTLALMTYVARSIRLTRLKNDLIATVTHELKTPLASMRLLVDTLRDDRMTDPTQAKEYLDLIASENQRLTRLIDNFLAFSRMERNKNAFVFELVDMTDVINDAVACVKDRFNAPDCALSVEIDASLHEHRIEADRDALVTVLLNLLDNAWKYTDAPKQLSVRGLAVNGSVFIEVADNGKGLTNREQARVFDRFYQVDQSLSRQVGGCGLGLSIVKFIVDAHDGNVSVKSTPGQGSTFTLQFPTDRGHLSSNTASPAGQGDEHA
ncbi:MAG: sensor histidine kinase [Phycisphaeraceae bacterium JB051]